MFFCDANDAETKWVIQYLQREEARVVCVHGFWFQPPGLGECDERVCDNALQVPVSVQPHKDQTTNGALIFIDCK